MVKRTAAEKHAAQAARVAAQARRNEESGDTRMELNKPAFEAPGARHGAANRKPHAAKTWARRDERLPGRSMRAERKAAEQAAVRHAAEETRTVAEQIADMDAQLSQRARVARAKARAKRAANSWGLVDARPRVWTLGSWTNGDEAYPDQPDWQWPDEPVASTNWVDYL